MKQIKIIIKIKKEDLKEFYKLHNDLDKYFLNRSVFHII